MRFAFFVGGWGQNRGFLRNSLGNRFFLAFFKLKVVQNRVFWGRCHEKSCSGLGLGYFGEDGFCKNAVFGIFYTGCGVKMAVS